MSTVDTDSIIIEGLREGRESAFRYIYEHHYALLCYVAMGYVKDAFVAETIVGDMIFHLWEVRESLEVRTSLRSYLLRAVRNRCINYLNLECNRREIASGLLREDDILESIAGEGAEPLGALLERELETKIHEAIERLPQDCRRVFEKSRFEGKTYDDIAAELGISVNTVKYHIRRALVQLHDDLSSYLPLSAILIVLQFRQFMAQS